MEKFIHAIEEKNQGFMAHSLCPYYTTYHPLNVDFIGFSALLYDKIRGFCLGLCLRSETASGAEAVFLIHKNPTLGVGFGEAYSFTYDRETPFAIMPLRSANCKGAKGGH